MRLAYVDSAIGMMRTVVTAEKRFAEMHPNRGYACAFSDLASTEPSLELSGRSQRNGYAFELICPSRNGGDANEHFQVTARPLEKDLPAYCSDQSGIVRYDEGGSPAGCLLNGSTL